MSIVFRHSSLTKGVSYDRGSKRWVGRFTLNGQRYYIGSFKEESSAAQAVNRARINVASSSYLRNEVKDLLEEEKNQINSNASYMSSVQEWNTLTLGKIKYFAEKHGITHDDVIGDKRFKQNWIDVLNARDVRPITDKEPEIASAVDEIDGLIAYLYEDEEEDRNFSDAVVLDLAEEEWSPCVVIDPKEPVYYWCSGGFLYTLYPSEGYTVWRYDTTVSGNYKPIGVWNGDEQNDNDDEEKGSQWEVSVDKDAGTYCKISRSVELEEGEILENWAEDAVISVPLSQNRNHSFPQGKSARSW